MTNRTKLVLLNKPWILLFTSLIYIMFVQSLIGFADCYWDFPYEKAEAAKSWGEDPDLFRRPRSVEECKKDLDLYNKNKASWEPLNELSSDIRIKEKTENCNLAIEATIIHEKKNIVSSQIAEFKKIKRLYLDKPMTNVSSSNSNETLIIPDYLNKYINDLYEKVYLKLEEQVKQGVVLTNTDVKKIVLSTIMTDNNNNVWIMSNRDQIMDHNHPYNILISIYGKHHAACQTKSARWIIGTIATTTSIMQVDCFSFTANIKELNKIVEQEVLADHTFNHMLNSFLIGYAKK